MEPLEVLSEAVIDTLKEFSIGKGPLTSTILQEAFSAGAEIVSLLYPVLNDQLYGYLTSLPAMEERICSPFFMEAMPEAREMLPKRYGAVLRKPVSATWMR